MRRLLFRLHLLVALAAGLLVSGISLTGGLLVFGRELDALLFPELMRVRASCCRAPLDSALANVRAAFPNHRPERINLSPQADESIEIVLSPDNRRAFIDPGTAAVLGSLGEYEGLRGGVRAFHTKLLLGETGKHLLGAGGVALLILYGTGLIVWWPCRHRPQKLHTRYGVGTAILVIPAALTGVLLVWHKYPAAKRAPIQTAYSVDRAIDAANRALPGGRVSIVTLRTLTIRKQLPGEIHPNGRTSIEVDPATYAVTRAVDGRSAPLLDRFTFPVHTGAWGGLAVRVLLALSGAAPGVLFVSGLWLWRRRVKRRYIMTPNGPTRISRLRDHGVSDGEAPARSGARGGAVVAYRREGA